MTVITGDVRDIGMQALSGALIATAVEFRTSGDFVVAPESRSWPIVAGQVEVDLLPGPTRLTVQVGSHARESFDVIVPDEPVTLARLVEDAYPWTPAVVSAVAAHRQAAEEAASRAEAAAEDVDSAIAGAADAVVAEVEADRVAAEQAAAAASSSASAADSSAGDASAAASAAASSAQDAAGSASAAAGSAQDASSSASAAAGSASDAAQSASAAASSATVASDGAQTVTDNLDAINAAPGAAQAAQDARDVAEGHASDAAGSASAAAQSATDADSHRAAAAGSETAAGQSATDADQHRQAAEGHATDAATALSGAEDARAAAQQARSGAEDERVVAEDAAALAEGHAQAADGHRVDAEAAAALAQSLRWVIKGAWEPGQYEAGDVVVWEERAYYAQTATSVEPPAQPWIPLTPAGGGGASHWDDLDGKPSVFPPEAHGHDAADVTGDATPNLDVTEASVGAQSVGEALDGKSDTGHHHDGRYVSLAGNDTKTGNLDMDGGSVTFVRPDITGGLARGLRWADRNGSLIGGIGAYGGPSGLHYFYFGHGDQPWEDPIIEGRPDRVEINGDLDVTGTVSGVGVSDVDGLQDALDETTDASRLEGALTDQVDASGAEVTFQEWDPDTESMKDTTSRLADMITMLVSYGVNFDWIADQLEGKADVNHTHTVADLTASGTASSSTFLRGDGSWATPPNTTYAVPSQAEAEAGTATTGRAFSAQRVRQAINAHPRVAAAPATWRWDGTSLPTSASQVHAQARVGDFIVAPNLTTDPGWHQITGV